MGGMGSGNRCQSGKSTTDDMRVIDVRYLQREGLLKAGHLNTLIWRRNGIQTADIKLLASHHDVRLMYKSRSYGHPQHVF